MSESAPGASGFLYANAALRVLEQAAIEDAGGDGFALMARAGAAACRVALARWPQARRIVVVCGPGNNGGDGHVFARHALQAGRDVRVVHAQAYMPRSALAQRAAREFIAAGGNVGTFEGPFEPCDLVVDAVLGIGLARAIRAAVSGRPGGVYLDLPAKLFGQVMNADAGQKSLVKVIDEAPWVSRIAGRHGAQIGGFTMAPGNGRVVVVATLDNLLKGAATQAMQNLNLALGFDELTSIPQ